MQAIVKTKTLQLTMEQSSHDCSRRASGVLALMDRFSTYFGLKLSILIFSMIEQLSITLQSINTTANDGFFAVVIQALQRIRSDELFLSFFEMVRNETKQPWSSGFTQKETNP